MKRLLTPLAISLALPLGLGGCAASATYGQRIESTKVTEIVKGKTTKDELTAWFGQPANTYMMPDGGRTITWTYFTQKAGAFDWAKDAAKVMTGKYHTNQSGSPVTTLSVVVDKDGIVRDYEFTPGSKQ